MKRDRQYFLTLSDDAEIKPCVDIYERNESQLYNHIRCLSFETNADAEQWIAELTITNETITH